MELVHRKTGVARLIGKAVLVGILVTVFAKAILALLGLACIGFVVFCCARALYLGRGKLRRLAVGFEEATQFVSAMAWAVVAVLLLATRGLLLSACWTLFWLSRFAKSACVLLGLTLVVGCSYVWEKVLWLQRVVRGMLQWLLCWSGRTLGFTLQLPIRGCRILARTAELVFAKIHSQAHLIGGTLVEATSGAVVGVLVFNLPSIGSLTSLADVNALEPRACAAALFGAFLGAVLGFSRMRWAGESEVADGSKAQS